MTTTAGHSFYIGPIDFFYNQVNDTGSWEPLVLSYLILSMICDEVCQWFATCRWFSHDTPVSSTNKTDRLDITKILLKVALNTINQPTNHDKTCDKHTYIWLEEWIVFNIRYLSRRGQWGHPTQLWKVLNCILNMEAKNKRKWFMVYFEAKLLYFAWQLWKHLTSSHTSFHSYASARLVI